MMMADRHPVRRAARAAGMLLLLAGAMPVARAAVSATPPSPAVSHAAKSAAAKAPAAQVSPHARAARARALARAEAEGKPMRVSPFGTTPKPHRPVQPH